MEEIIKLLKSNREYFLNYQEKINRNILLCMFGLILDEDVSQSQDEEFQNMIAYFSLEKMHFLEIGMIKKENFPTYSIAGITFVDNKMLYFATVRINANKKMTTKQKNYDDMYCNKKINVFENEEDFVRFICTSNDFCDEEIMISDLYELIQYNIDKSSLHYPKRNNTKMESTISDGILNINPVSSLVSQMIKC
ncbi:MAG: hypothetical protein WC010_03900 [Candidatus Absconditabacterales bacterium]